MDDGVRYAGPHLRVQVTLTVSRRLPTGSRSGPVHTQLRVGTRHFPCEIQPEQPLVPGGHAVHGAVFFADPAGALPHFPAGTNFEVWENGRAGYGTVLSVAHR